MSNIENIVFQDKSWVRFTDYQKLKDRYEALEETNEYQNDAICRLQKQIEKMKCCFNCAHFSGGFMCVFRCEKDDEIRKSVVTKKDVKKAICNNWRLAE